MQKCLTPLLNILKPWNYKLLITIPFALHVLILTKFEPTWTNFIAKSKLVYIPINKSI